MTQKVNELSPELMEMIEDAYPVSHEIIRAKLLANGLPEGFIDADKLMKRANENLFRRVVAIYGASLALQQQWVKVSERLPEDDSAVITYNGKIGIGWFFVGEFVNNSKVTHWMPLPLPPNDVEQKEK